jgi:type IV pilus assembly protein PilF
MILPSLFLFGGCSTPSGVSDSASIGTVDSSISRSDDGEARKRARIRLELAVNYFDQGQTAVALDELKQVLNVDPNFGDAYNLRGLIYMRLNDFRQAEDGFKRALSLNPRDADVLHNYGWLVCQQQRYAEANQMFSEALKSPLYAGKAKTFMAQGLCQARSGQKAEAERSLARSYELDAANPITGYNLAILLFQRDDLARAQFYIRRLNNSEYANAESLWLGIRVERKVGDKVAMAQLADQLKRRFPQARELSSYERGAFDE